MGNLRNINEIVNPCIATLRTVTKVKSELPFLLILYFYCMERSEDFVRSIYVP